LHAAPFLGIPDAHGYLGATIGLAAIQGSGTSQTQIAVSSNTPDTFATHGTHQGTMFGLVGGINIPHHTTWFNSYQLEASLWQLGNAAVDGTHTMPPSLHNWQYDYRYNLQLQAVSFDTAVNIYEWHRLLPFVGIGVDLARATTNNYQETPQGDAQSTALSFADQTKNLFLYHARVGLRYQLPKHWQVQLAYTYYPTVKISTGAGNTGVISVPGVNSKVSISNLGLMLRYQF
jgi:opacity protein-like surface antigen